MIPKDYLKNKKVLVMGLGLLGGGVATAKWLVKHRAKVTVTDLKTKKELADSIKALGPAADKIKFVLGRHLASDFRSHSIVVVNPAVPRESLYLKIARENGAQLENEASLFFRFCRNPIIGVTGTRGKTTTANWTYHLLKQKFPNAVLAGNSSDNSMLKALDKLDGKSPVVVELSSWHLELLPQSKKTPHIAVITNLHPDHLNRYKNMRDYARAKANIFKRQTKNDFLILNRGDKWTKLFIKQKPISRVIYFPAIADISLIPRKFSAEWGRHNFENLSATIAVARLAGIKSALIKKALATLPQIKFRQEVIYKKNGLTIVNDTAATSPDATIAALRRFSPAAKNLILITGGTDKNLIFGEWAAAVKKFVKKENLFLLEGSATNKMVAALNKTSEVRPRKWKLYPALPPLLTAAIEHAKMVKTAIVLFSPSAASFEKFKNEFDRGERFNQTIKAMLKGEPQHGQQPSPLLSGLAGVKRR